MSERRFGILIASSQFPNEPKLEDLRFPENDVDGLNELLISPDHGQFTQTFVLKNQLHHKISIEIDQVLSKVDKNDLVLIYYSGHGKLNPAGKLHLVCTNTSLGALAATSIPVSWIKECVDSSSSNKIILILDCCFSGAAGDIFTKSGVDDQLQLISKGRGTYIMTASTGIQVAQEKETDQYGAFTKHIIEGIKSGEADLDCDGRITMSELYHYVYDHVRDEGFQVPMKWDLSVRGELIIANSGRTPRENRYKRIRTILFDLANKDILPDDILNRALNVINPDEAQLSEEDRTYDALLDRLFERQIVVGEFISRWYRIKRDHEDLRRKAERDKRRKEQEAQEQKAAEEKRRKEQELKRKAEEEHQKREAEAKQKAEEIEAQRKIEDETKRREEEQKRIEAARKAEEERQRKEAEAKRKAEEEGRQKKETEAKRIAEEEEQNRIEAARKADEARKQKEAAAKRKADDEKRRKEKEEQERKAAEEKRRKEQELKQKTEEERQKKDTEAKRKAEVEQKKKEIEKQRKIEEERKHKEEEKNRMEASSKLFATTILKANIGWLIGFVLGAAFLNGSQHSGTDLFWSIIDDYWRVPTLLSISIFSTLGGAIGGGFTAISLKRRLPNIKLSHVIIATIGCAICGTVGGGLYVLLMGFSFLALENFALAWTFIWAIGWFLGGKIIYWSLGQPRPKR